MENTEAPRARAQKLSVERLSSNVLLLVLLSAIFVIIALYLIITSQSLADQTTSSIGFGIGLLILAIAFIFFVWPTLTPNLLTPTRLVVRFGCIFNMSIALSNIESVEQLIGPAGPIGTRYSLIDRRYSVLRCRHGAVKIILRREATTGLLLRRSVKELVIDCSSPDALLRRLGDRGD